MKLTLLIRQGKTQLIGQLKEIPGVLTQGKTVEEVKENIQDALALYLEDMREDDDAIIAREEVEFA
ncbi:type II toxin-antitoxin system HicB family antitoxin [Hymenobacter bucti]|uniref:Type II toxin-antitoxin system HicB family antitoxin n=1 Tax=Hymenobacter bucti TaxID=1844114 RepID=A0ABW4QSX7_9BACT